jgi:hypothetical protein
LRDSRSTSIRRNSFSTDATQSKINLGDGVKVNTLCASMTPDARISLYRPDGQAWACEIS